MLHPTVAEIDLGALAHNLCALRSLLAPDVEIIGVVKADAYGHGCVPISRVLAAEGVRHLAVATLNEAATLQDAGVPGRILIFGARFAEQVPEIVEREVETVVTDMNFARRLDEEARARKQRATVHLKFDTGMGRIGFPTQDALDVCRSVAQLPGLRVAGAMTHFPSADESEADDFTRAQIRAFAGIRREVQASGLQIPLWHAANSAGLLWHSDSHFNAVRPGLALYGSYFRQSGERLLQLRQVMRFKTRIALLRDLPSNTTVSYGRTFRTQRPSRIAVLPLGYADGYSRTLSNKGHVLVRGRRAPIAGRVCMDLCMADVTDIPDARVGDEVVLFGRQGAEEISIEEVARSSGTIPNNVMTAISARVRRVYVGDGPGTRGEPPMR